VVNDMRGGGPARVDTNLSPDALEQAVREQAGNIDLGHETASAYHARKHYREIPVLEKSGNRIRDYLDSAERTIRHGDITSRTTLDNGSERLTITRPKLDANGNQVIRGDKKAFMRAFVIVQPNGDIVMTTYGEQYTSK